MSLFIKVTSAYIIYHYGCCTHSINTLTLFLVAQGPYTLDGLTAKAQNVLDPTVPVPSCPYTLVGVVVHSGQANGGHYYSFIRERNETGVPTGRRWLRFDDTEVTEFDIDPERDWYGGEYFVEMWDAATKRFSLFFFVGVCL